jgi:hypothetical protein
MLSKYEQYEAVASSYEKHPDQGLKACKKKLQRDPNNVIYLVSSHLPTGPPESLKLISSTACPGTLLAETQPR